MDGELNPLLPPDAGVGEAVARERIGPARPAIDGMAARRPKTVRWLLIVGALLVVVLGGFYGFNRYRTQAIATFFANNKPPPAQIAAVTAKSETVPRFAGGIGSLAAVHQVTITPEIGGLATGIQFQPGATVKAGDPLVQLNDAPERGDLANYQAQERWAAISLQRSQSLAQRQNAAQSTVDQNQTQFEQARAQITKTEAIIAQKLIRAPFAGRLGLRQIELGQFLSAGTPIVTLTDLTQLYVNFTLPSTDRAEIAVGQDVAVTADAFPGRAFQAKITTIEPQIRADTRTMMVQATLANPDEALPPAPDRVVLPETAIDFTLYGDSVYVIRDEGKDAGDKPLVKAFRTPVKTGTRWGGKVAILSGVSPGDRVVAAGQIKLQEGASVVVTANPPPPPPANPTPQ